MTAACHFEQPCLSFGKQEGSQSAHSRSTSPGSSSASNSDEANPHDQSHSSLSKLPDYDYPAPVFVRNTFLDTPLVRPLSLDEFFQERRIQSCPIGRSDFRDDDAQEEVEAQQSKFHRAATLSATLLTDVANEASRAVSSFCTWWDPAASCTLQAASPTQVSEPVGYKIPSQGASQVIVARYKRLSNPVQEPKLGSNELPTVGSADHKSGACKPCAFLYKRGCENGVQCAFCHLCDEGAKKRRQKEKILRLKEMRGHA